MSQEAYKTSHVIQPVLTLLFPEALSGVYLLTVVPTNGDHDTGHLAEREAQNHGPFIISSTTLMILNKACT